MTQDMFAFSTARVTSSKVKEIEKKTKEVEDLRKRYNSINPTTDELLKDANAAYAELEKAKKELKELIA
jgi:DNA repair exonuclease SbcCD ATPase subunit